MKVKSRNPQKHSLTAPIIIACISYLFSISPSLAGGDHSGGGGLSQAKTFESKNPTLLLQNKISQQVPAQDIYGRWRAESQHFLQPAKWYEQRQNIFFLQRRGVKMVYFLYLGNYHFPSSNGFRVKANEKFPDINSRFEYLRNALSLNERYLFPGYTSDIKFEEGENLQIQSEPVAAINEPKQDKITYDINSWLRGNDCAETFMEDVDQNKCLVLSANLLGAHEALSLVGLEENGAYPLSNSLRYLLHDADSADIGNFSQALSAGILLFYKLSGDPAAIASLATYGGKQPGSNLEEYFRKYNFAEKMFWSDAYRKAIEPRNDARLDIEYILSRTRNRHVRAELLRTRAFLFEQMQIINRYYSSVVSSDEIIRFSKN